MKITLFIFMTFFFSSLSFAQDFVYKPKNPAFGGDTFNYQWLASSAESQNTFKDPEEDSGKDNRSELERFTENLNNQLLNQISRNLFTQQFGSEGNLSPGTYTFGNLFVEIYESNQGLVIDILDTNTGDQTHVIIP